MVAIRKSLLALCLMVVVLFAFAPSEAHALTNTARDASAFIPASNLVRRATSTKDRATAIDEQPEIHRLIVRGSTAGIFFGIGFAAAFAITGILIYASRDVPGTYRVVGMSAADYYNGPAIVPAGNVAAAKSPITSPRSSRPLPIVPDSGLPYPATANGVMPPRVDSMRA